MWATATTVIRSDRRRRSRRHGTGSLERAWIAPPAVAPGRPDWPGVRGVHTLVGRRENFSLEPVTQTALTVVVPFNVGVELRLGCRVPDGYSVLPLLTCRVAGCTPLGKVSSDLFVRNGRDLATANVIDTRANFVGPRFIDNVLVGHLE